MKEPLPELDQVIVPAGVLDPVPLVSATVAVHVVPAPTGRVAARHETVVEVDLLLTVTVASALAPFASVTRTTSETPPVAPDVYTPVVPLIVAPELLVGTLNVFAPAPPVAAKVWLPLTKTVAVVGEIVNAVVTVRLKVSLLELPVPEGSYFPLILCGDAVPAVGV